MHKLIIFCGIVACGFAAPVEHKDSSAGTLLDRPSPINPDIPSDPKPEERVILISTEKPLITEDPVIKPLGPYALPSQPKQHFKRENTDSTSSSSNDENSSEEVKKPTTILKPISHSLLSTTSAAEKLAGAALDEATTATTATTTNKKPYSPIIHQHNEHLFKPTTEAGSPAIVPTAAATVVHDNASGKHDIPIESSQKAESNADKTSPKVEVKQEDVSQPQPVHPATISRPIPVAELFAKKPSTAAP